MIVKLIKSSGNYWSHDDSLCLFPEKIRFTFPFPCLSFAGAWGAFLFFLRMTEKTHGICCPALLNSWIKKYSNLAEELSLPSEQESPDMSNRSKEAYKDENAQLKKRIKELEKALSFSKLETEARELMITRAEELFNIPIRKKSGAKS